MRAFWSSLSLTVWALCFILRFCISSAQTDDSSDCSFSYLIGNGYCESSSNTAECGYDGGDCCECTCVDGLFFACGDLSDYNCLDPYTNCSTTTTDEDDEGDDNGSDYGDDYGDDDGDDDEYPNCITSSLNGNGNCEASNNNADCGYDGGDCCSCTCQDSVFFTCGGLLGYDCQDPYANCSTTTTDEDDDGDDDEYPNCILTSLNGNGNCEASNNNADCGYDGGDCCSCTCQDSVFFTCGGLLGYDCQDPYANCSTTITDEDDDGGDDEYPNCILTSLNGNGNCEASNNNADCGYDGGDCCSCTCQDGTFFTCGGLLGYDCQDPSADCPTSTSDDGYPNCGFSSLLIGNGNCDSSNNDADCGYDGGDCCPCTCVDGTVFTCGGLLGYDCQDPSADCSSDFEVDASSVDTDYKKSKTRATLVTATVLSGAALLLLLVGYCVCGKA